MTCEIAVMNRYAIALAADSAGTVTSWRNGKEEKRFFKGENKIFQLSAYHPVGLMTFSNANLQGAPWELLIKQFRKHLNQKPLETLPDYAEALFEYVANLKDIYSQDQQDRFFLATIENICIRYLFRAIETDSYLNATDDASIFAALSSFVDAELASTTSIDISPPFSEQHISDAIKQYAPTTIEALKMKGGQFEGLDVFSLVELSINSLIRSYRSYLEYTGIVIGGFGDKDHFPSLVSYRCYGLLLGEFLFEGETEKQINLENHSEIIGFASTDMINTFTMGVGPNGYAFANTEFKRAAQTLATSVATELGATDISNLDQHINTATKSFNDNWFSSMLDANYWPITRVVSMLPIDEMAELAETLINLESLKEKVTSPTESIGGAVDVAIISKIDGFIWIKRKHYFDPSLNTRFFQRQNISNVESGDSSGGE